ncbi:MAG: NAD(P)H-dependent glycerol-3-phosphate dehydrogenase [Tissierellia bacterium]|nr:NAD(P)H-dependent glycerol-3-phosphate dehydrogenase [Tissierellia bacterium]
MKITVIGGGSWGTAIARLLGNKNHDVNFYMRERDVAEDIIKNHENSRFLPNCTLSTKINIFTNFDQGIKDAEIIVLGVPSDASRIILKDLQDKISSDVIIVNLSKGIEVDTLLRISEVAEEILPHNPFVCLSGPSHAEEVGKDVPTAVVVSSRDEKASKIVQEEFSTSVFRIYTNSDLVGVEMGGALKNIIALAAGLSDGLGYGDNTKAALMTRGIYEMSKLGIEMGAMPQTLNGLSGIGDLIVTCTSMHSRNRRAGILIGQGKSTEKACQEIGQVVEGIKTTKSAYLLAQKHRIEMPITEKLYQVLYENQNAKEAVDHLMNREKKEEIEQIFFVS